MFNHEDSVIATGRFPVLLAVVVVVTQAAACSSVTTASPPSSSVGHKTTVTASIAPSKPATSPMDAAKRAALNAYRGMWDDYATAARTSAWMSPELSQNATGLALSTLSRGLYADHHNGLVSRGIPTHAVQVSSVDPPSSPTTVVVTDCSDSTNALKYRADNGQLANDSPGGRRLINATVQKQSDGSWKVSDFGVQGVGTC